MCHVCGFICSLCVELKLMINTRSLSNQVLKSAHPQLLSSRCWPWGVFIGAGQPLQHGEVRGINLAWVRPVVRTCLKSNEVDTFDLLPQLKNRRYPECNVIENELHFLLECTIKMKGWNYFTKSAIWIHTSAPCIRKINLFTWWKYERWKKYEMVF